MAKKKFCAFKAIYTDSLSIKQGMAIPHLFIIFLME